MRETLASPPTLHDSALDSHWAHGKGRFLIDGFPRKMDQALKFDETVSGSGSCLNLNALRED
jgi:UMP-CMP kinase